MRTFILFAILCISLSSRGQNVKWNGGVCDFSRGKLIVSKNKRFLTFEDETPFFYLGDTAWELFHRLNIDETEKYLKNRMEKGFTVIQSVILAELDGLNTPNAEGETPLINSDPTKINEVYFKHVDRVIKIAEEKGLFMGLLPTWGDKWNKKWGIGPEIFTPENAEIFGEVLGKRYKDSPNIIWIVGGDRPVENENHKMIIQAMAKGLRKGDGGAHLISFHPMGGQGSAEFFHNEKWLDFNMRQNGHNPNYPKVYENTSKDYALTPVKPVIDGEPIYEDHPIEFNPQQNGYSTSADVRRPLYWNLFSGAFGHTYGHHSVWQMWQPGRNPVNNPLIPWYEAIDQPGAWQMQFARRLLESRPFLTRIPDDSLIIPDDVEASVPGAGRYRFVATRDTDNTYAMIYVPVCRPFTVNLNIFDGKKIIARWYSPRNGMIHKIGKFKGEGKRKFSPPELGESIDWILVLDDVKAKYKLPGKISKN